MAEKINANKAGMALAIVSGVISLICGFLVLIVPGFTMNIFSALFHGIDISKIAVQLSMQSMLLGVAELMLLGYISGWLFGKVYNKI